MGASSSSFSSTVFALLLLASCFSTPFSAAEFTPSTNILLNCGSPDTATPPNDARAFVPDSSSNNVSLPSSSDSDTLTGGNPSAGTPSLYLTARVFTGRSSYRFTVGSTGVHVLRLHFFPFSAPRYDLFSAVFSVTALHKFRLLENFSVQRGAALPVVKEYLLWVDSSDVDVTFTPQTGGSVAFVSAVELFTAPAELIRGSERFDGVSAQLGLETVQRINMGGPLIVPSNDTLWRTWLPDDDFLYNKALAKAVNTTQPIRYRDDGGGSTEEIGPYGVYSTAQEMNVPVDNRDPRFNITWRFNVSGGDSHLVRMHFYDFVSKSAADLFFNLYVDEVAYKDLQPSRWAFNNFAVPFYFDTRVDGAGAAGGSRVMSVSVGRSEKSSPSTVNAILNGLEIMKVLNTSPESSGGSKKKFLFILIPSVLGALALLVGCLVLSARRRRRRQARRPAPDTKETATSWSPLPGAHSATTISKISHGTTTASPVTPRVINLGLHISLEDIKFATNNFDEGLVIGSGGFGKVYKGVLRDGTKVAVKRGMPGSMQGYPEFHTEVTVLSKIRHRHLVSLIGYCEEHSQMILVYEFMEKGTLKNLLYGGGVEAPCLSWKRRLEICISAARGIHYLHTGYSQGIIHRDLKSSNILLGEDYVAKVSDFGLSRLGPSLGETHVSTGVKGSFGYLDPEYFKTQKLTDKSDVYSFGVVLFEVLCARPVIDQGAVSRDQLNLAEWAAMAQRRGQLEQVVDSRLRGTINANSLRKFGETAVKCVAEYGVDRPAIGDVLWNLEYCLQLQETELRREPYEDSATCVSAEMPVAVRRVPSSNVRVEGAGGGDAAAGFDSDQMDFTTSKVFSQLITHEGR